MSEHEKYQPEHLKHDQETEQEHRKSAERAEELERAGQEAAEKQPEQLEQARHHVEKTAKQPEARAEGKGNKQLPPHRQQKAAIYRQTLHQIQQQLPGKGSPAFSRLIHQPAVEKVSEVAGKTLLRPSITLGASLGALVGGTALFLVAKRYGFRLSGSEFIIFAVAGGAIGLLAEATWLGVRKVLKKSS